MTLTGLESLLILLAVAVAFGEGDGAEPPGPRWTSAATSAVAMVESQIESRGVKDAAVLDAMRQVPRHLFVPDDARGEAYGDRPAAHRTAARRSRSPTSWR